MPGDGVLGLAAWEWLQYGFMRQALLAVVLLSWLFGLAGSMVVNARMAFFSDAIGHAALTGIAIGSLLGLGNPLWAMLLFSIFLALAIVWVRRVAAASIDTVIALFMALAVAWGVMILSRGGGFNKYTRYLIGDILGISPQDLLGLAILALAATAVFYVTYNRIALTGFNSSWARSRGLKVGLWQGLFAAMVAAIVTVSIQWVGVLVVNSMLILPAAAARNLAADVRAYVWLTVALSLISGVVGLIASYYWATASGATIVIVAMGFFLLSLICKRR